MTRYISILRGINVSGHKKIKMADLKALYEKQGFKNVVTYIQSGNVIFEAPSNDLHNIKLQIEVAIEKKYSFHVDVQLRSESELNETCSKLPFENINLEQDGSKVLVTFLSGQPDAKAFDQLSKYAAPSEKLMLGDRVLYLHCPDGYGKTKLSNVLIEKKLNQISTTRNLRTVVKLCELAKE
tara:strand:+ start:233781 stop:234326 length:546 start_codon:yes stop_codon:yes gene_type:complete